MTFSLSHFPTLGVTFSLSLDISRPEQNAHIRENESFRIHSGVSHPLRTDALDRAPLNKAPQ